MSENKGPIIKTKSGHFQVSIWSQGKVVPARSDFSAEREVTAQRACVQHSNWNRITREWENQNIWCSVDELRSLVKALDELNEVPGLDPPRDPDTR